MAGLSYNRRYDKVNPKIRNMVFENLPISPIVVILIVLFVYYALPYILEYFGIQLSELTRALIVGVFAIVLACWALYNYQKRTGKTAKQIEDELNKWSREK